MECWYGKREHVVDNVSMLWTMWACLGQCGHVRDNVGMLGTMWAC